MYITVNKFEIRYLKAAEYFTGLRSAVCTMENRCPTSTSTSPASELPAALRKLFFFAWVGAWNEKGIFLMSFLSQSADSVMPEVFTKHSCL